MNIFVLDLDIRTCARYHADQHVIKIILESVRMLFTVINESGGRLACKTTHPHHPCTLWAGESLSNWRWLKRLALALNDEYQYRYRTVKDHCSAGMLRNSTRLQLWIWS